MNRPYEPGDTPIKVEKHMAMTLAEHAERIRDTLKKMEHATARHHAALQALLEEHGAAVGLDEAQIIALGGGTPKTPPQVDG